MNLIILLVVGGILGWVASLIMRTDGQQGILLNIVVGIVGAILAGFLLNPLIRSTSSFTEKPIIVIAADNSASIAKNKDSVFYKKEFS